MNLSQNVLEMSAVSPAHAETATPLTDGCNNKQSSFLHSTNSLYFSSKRHH